MPAAALLQASADFDILMKTGKHWAALRANRRRDDHAVRFDSAKLTRREIGDHSNLAADKRFRLVILGNPSTDLPNFRADIDRELKKFVGADDPLCGLDLADSHFDFGEVLDADLFGRCRRDRGAR